LVLFVENYYKFVPSRNRSAVAPALLVVGASDAVPDRRRAIKDRQLLIAGTAGINSALTKRIPLRIIVSMPPMMKNTPIQPPPVFFSKIII